MRAIFSWISVGPGNPLVNIVYDITEPILAPFRQFARIGSIDLSPMVASFLLIIIARVIGAALT